VTTTRTEVEAAEVAAANVAAAEVAEAVAEVVTAAGVAEPPAWPTGDDADCAADCARMAFTISGHASSSTSTAGRSIQVRRIRGFSAPRAPAFSRQAGQGTSATSALTPSVTSRR
jgi:hypothetical protein